MKKEALEYHHKGFSCSESIVQAAIDAGLCDKSLLAVATPFSAGLSSGCLCGAIAGAQIVLGYLFGKENSRNNEVVARNKAKQFVEEFKKKRKVTCCKALTAGFEFGSAERRQNCEKLVEECAEILENMVGEKVC